MKLKLLLASAILISLVSCKDETDPTPTNNNQNNSSESSFTYKGTKYNTPNGLVYDFGTTDGIHDRDLYFTNIPIEDAFIDSGEYTNSSAIAFDLQGTIGSDELEVGTYTYSEVDKPFSIVDASAYGNVTVVFNEEEETRTVNSGGFDEDNLDDWLTDGTVEVTKNDSIYTVIYTLEFGADVISGEYKGEIETIPLQFENKSKPLSSIGHK